MLFLSCAADKLLAFFPFKSLEMPKGTAFLKGDYWHIPVVSEAEAKRATGRKIHSVERKGHMKRVTGKINGKRKTIEWRISKDDVSIDLDSGCLFTDDPEKEEILEQIECELREMIKVRKQDRLIEIINPHTKPFDKKRLLEFLGSFLLLILVAGLMSSLFTLLLAPLAETIGILGDLIPLGGAFLFLIIVNATPESKPKKASLVKVLAMFAGVAFMGSILTTLFPAFAPYILSIDFTVTGLVWTAVYIVVVRAY